MNYFFFHSVCHLVTLPTTCKMGGRMLGSLAVEFGVFNFGFNQSIAVTVQELQLFLMHIPTFSKVQK